MKNAFPLLTLALGLAACDVAVNVENTAFLGRAHTGGDIGQAVQRIYQLLDERGEWRRMTRADRKTATKGVA